MKHSSLQQHQAFWAAIKYNVKQKQKKPPTISDDPWLDEDSFDEEYHARVIQLQLDQLAQALEA